MIGLPRRILTPRRLLFRIKRILIYFIIATLLALLLLSVTFWNPSITASAASEAIPTTSYRFNFDEIKEMFSDYLLEYCCCNLNVSYGMATLRFDNRDFDGAGVMYTYNWGYFIIRELELGYKFDLRTGFLTPIAQSNVRKIGKPNGQAIVVCENFTFTEYQEGSITPPIESPPPDQPPSDPAPDIPDDILPIVEAINNQTELLQSQYEMQNNHLIILTGISAITLGGLVGLGFLIHWKPTND